MVTANSDNKPIFFLELYRKAQSLHKNDLYEYFLDHAVKITKSKIGFFHFVGDDQETITLTAWNKEASKNCSTSFDTHYPLEKAGNWADCIRLKRPVIYNDFKNSPNQKGLPEGHVDISRMLTFPLIERNKVIAIFGVGNKDENYDQDDVIQLSLIASELNKIIKQRRAEAEMLESKEKYRSLFENMLDGFVLCKVIFDERGKPIDFECLEVNGAFERLSGLKREDIVGKRVTTAMPAVQKLNPELLELYSEVAASFEPEKFETFIEPLNIWLSISAYCPQKGYFAAVFENITERKEAEQELWRAKNDWERTFDSVPDLVAILDNQFRIMRANRPMAEQLGVSPEKAIGLFCYQCVHELNDPPDFCPHLQTVKDGKEHTAEVHEPRLGGDFLVSTTPLRDEKGRMIGSVHVARNITERKKVEKEIARLASFPKLNPNAVFEVDFNGKITYANPATKVLFPTLEKLGLDHPLLSDWQKITKSFEDRTVTWFKREKKVDEHWYQQQLYLVPESDLIRTYTVDIDETKKSEEALAKLNRHLRAISNSNQALMHAKDEATYTQEVCNIVIKDCGYALVWVGFAENDKAKTVRPVAYAGFDKNYIEALRITWDENSERGQGPTGAVIRTGKTYVCDMKSDVHFKPWLREAHRRGYTASLVLPLNTLDGKTFGAFNIYSREANPFTDEEIKLLTELSNDFAYGIIMLRLRKERERAEEALLESKSLIDTVFASMNDGTITFNAAGEVLQANESFMKLYGFKSKEEVPRTIQDFAKVIEVVSTDGKIVLPQDFTAARALRGEMGIQEFSVTKKKTGETWVANYSYAPLRGANREIIGAVLSVQDITLRRKMQDKLREYAKNLEALVEERTKALRDSERLAAIGATAGMVGHDIRNPLQAITGDVFLLKTELASELESEEKKNAFESLDEIEKNIDYINKIVQDLQDYARPLNPKIEETDLMLTVESLISKKNGLPENVQVTIDIADDARKVNVDSYYLNRILNNLVTNAVQAMPNGGTLTLQAHKEANDIILIVKDTGVGIPKKIQDKLFTLMFTTKAKGQGFGLPVVKRMIESLGGTVTFESQEGKGTTFTVRLPSKGNNSKIDFKSS